MSQLGADARGHNPVRDANDARAAEQVRFRLHARHAVAESSKISCRMLTQPSPMQYRKDSAFKSTLEEVMRRRDPLNAHTHLAGVVMRDRWGYHSC